MNAAIIACFFTKEFWLLVLITNKIFMVYFCILYNEKTVQIKREGATGFLKERDFQVRRSFEKEASFSQKPEIESSKLYLHSMHGD